MKQFVPEHPTTQELQSKYPLSPEAREAIAAKRERVSTILGGMSTELLVVVGPCAMTAEEAALRHEAEQLALLDSGIVGLIRQPDFKPRTNPEAWHGLITSDPETAYRSLQGTSEDFANVAIEIGTDPEHLRRNAPFTTLAWKGGRNDEEPELTEALALHDPSLPVAVKNGLDGNLEKALADVEAIEMMRRGMGARAILLFRGGENAKDPATLEEQYLLAHDLTGGRFLVDWAHGGEQAHDPESKFGKSVEGQEAWMNHVIDIAEHTGKTPVGIFSEASYTHSPTDPVMPPHIAIDGAQRLAKIKQSLFV